MSNLPEETQEFRGLDAKIIEELHLTPEEFIFAQLSFLTKVNNGVRARLANMSTQLHYDYNKLSLTEMRKYHEGCSILHNTNIGNRDLYRELAEKLGIQKDRLDQIEWYITQNETQI